MRHAQVDSLIDRLVVGACSPAEARAVASHAIGCARCTVRIATARRLLADDQTLDKTMTRSPELARRLPHLRLGAGLES